MADAEMPGHPTVAMRPIILDGCFGWIHGVENRVAADTAALFCCGIGRDNSTGYRSFRILGDALARAGYPAMRFSYPGTGDSSDVKNGDLWSAWRRSVRSAIDVLKEETGARKIILVGLRFGGALAAHVASECDDVCALILLEPVVRGKSYATQLRLEAGIRNGFSEATDKGVSVHGLTLCQETLKQIAEFDLRQISLPPKCHVLVLSDSSSVVLQNCKEAWRLSETPVAHRSFAGLEAFLRPSHLADEPPPDFRHLMAWLQASVPLRSKFDLARVGAAMLGLKHPGCVEIPLMFGKDRSLFGMLCQPDNSAPCDKIVIIGNSGGDPHDGFARFSVEFGRRLAQLGIASLRMDFAGLGDSVNGQDDREGATHTFEVDRTRDFGAAIDIVESLGFVHIALQGSCSGAYHALRGAVADRRVTALLSINLPWFTLRYEKAGPQSGARQMISNLAERRTRCLLFYAEGDPGVNALERHFGEEGQELAGWEGCSVSILSGLDHDLTAPEMRKRAGDHLIAFLRQDQQWVRERGLALEAVGRQADMSTVHPVMMLGEK